MDVRYFINELRRHNLFCVVRTSQEITIVGVPPVGSKSMEPLKVRVDASLILSTPASDVGTLIESIKLEILFL